MRASPEWAIHMAPNRDLPRPPGDKYCLGGYASGDFTSSVLKVRRVGAGVRIYHVF
jgi:hypothetical protein